MVYRLALRFIVLRLNLAIRQILASDQFGLNLVLKEGALNFDQTPAKERITLLGQDIENRVNYADEASKKEFLKFLKDAFKNGESIGEVLQNIAPKEDLAGEQAPQETPEEKKFKSIQATSKSQTYVYKDIKREFFENFLKAEREKGTDIMDLLRKTGKMGLDLKA